ncbi:MAG: endonuclease domain-containing protein [Microvirga sp.]
MTTEQRRFGRHLRGHATAAEDKLWQALRGRRLAGLKWRRQVPLLIYTVDFLCISAKLIVEIDGARHTVDAEYDHRRTEELARIGFEVLRFSNEEVLGDIDRVLERIASAALNGPTAGPSPLPLSHSGGGIAKAETSNGFDL